MKNFVQTAFNFRVNFHQVNPFAPGRQSHEVVTACLLARILALHRGAPVPGRSSVNKQTGFRKFGCADTANLAAPEDAAPYTHLATRKRGLLNLKRSRFEAQSQRDCASKPRVARNELPWVNVHPSCQPQRGCATARRQRRNPLWGWGNSTALPREAPAAPSQPWALLRNPVGIEDAGAVQHQDV